MKTEKPAFIREAQKMIRRYINMSLSLSDSWLVTDDVKVLWVAEVGRDWLVFMSVSPLDGKRYSVRYDSAEKTTLIDTYTVVGKTEVLDEE